MFNHNMDTLKEKISTCSISDEQVKSTIRNVLANDKYLLDPHGAVAYQALKDYLITNESAKGIFLETAHPVKFYDVVEPVIQQQVPVPESVQKQLNKVKQSFKIAADSNLLKSFLKDL